MLKRWISFVIGRFLDFIVAWVQGHQELQDRLNKAILAQDLGFEVAESLQTLRNRVKYPWGMDVAAFTAGIQFARDVFYETLSENVKEVFEL